MITKVLLNDLEESLPKKILSSIISGLKNPVPLTIASCESTSEEISLSFTHVLTYKNMKVKVRCILNWETHTKDASTPKGFYIVLKGFCTNETEFVTDEAEYDIFDFRRKHSLSDLIKLIEKYDVSEWVSEQLNDFELSLRSRFDEKISA